MKLKQKEEGRRKSTMSSLKSFGKKKRRRQEDIETPLCSLEKLLESCRCGAGSSKGLKGVLRSTSVWIRVNKYAAKCFGQCCIGRIMPGSDPVLLDALKKCGGTVPGTESKIETEEEQLSWCRLGLEEAFFLVHCLHCLEIFDLDDLKHSPPPPATTTPTTSAEQPEPLSIQECWTKFMDLHCHFVKTYISYQHFRSKGYIVKSGIYYGCTHVLYERHPQVAHADYCVYAILQKDVGEEEGGGGGGDRKSRGGIPYEELQSLVRVSVNVKKQLVLLYVFFPTKVQQEEQEQASESKKSKADVSDWDIIRDVNMLPLVEVDEIKVTRWLPGTAPNG